jgi:hypothetical protein
VNGPSWSGERDTERTRIARAIDPALLRRHAGVLRKSKNYDETFLTEPASLEMFSTII